MIKKWIRNYLGIKELEHYLAFTLKELYKMSAGYDLLTTKVNELSATADQVLAVVNTLKEQVGSGMSLAEAEAIATELDAQKAKLASVLV